MIERNYLCPGEAPELNPYFPHESIVKTIRRNNPIKAVNFDTLSSYIQEQTLNADIKLFADMSTCIEGFGYGAEVRDLFYDGDYAVLMIATGCPVARVSFNITGSEVNIVQIQGTKGKAKELQKLSGWDDTLVKTVENFATSIECQKMGINFVSIQPAFKNKWVKKEGHLKPEKGMCRYDDLAKRMGYVYDESRFLYIKSI